MTSKVAIVGAGLVGATAALALAQKGFAVELVERQPPRLNRGGLGVDIRNVALSPASRTLLNSIGIWPAAAHYDRMVVWEQWGGSRLEFSATEVQRKELGWIVEMSPLSRDLWMACQASRDVHITLGDITAIHNTDDQVSLHLGDGKVITADFLLAADGARSTVRRLLKLATVQTPVNQVALATVVKTEFRHQHTAWQRFLVDGPLALLPAPDPHLCSVVWSQSPETGQRRMTLDDTDFLLEITKATEACLGQVQAVDQRVVFPLRQQQVKNCYPHPRILLIGDAMRVVHPLAGLGVNLGFEDVDQLVKVASRQQNLAFPDLWRRFARQRQARSRAMIGTLDMLKRVYGLGGPGGTLLRNTGVSAFNALPALKRQVMIEAMGLGPLSSPD